MPHSVYLSCEAPGLLLANGRCLGSLQPQGPHPTRRVCLQGEAFLQFFPFSQAAMPSCLRFFSGPQGSAVQGGLLRLWPGGQLELRFGAPEPPRQEDLPTLLAKSFLQSVAGGLRASALLALSQNLLACVDFDGLRAFLGPFSGFETARFVPPGEGGLTLAVYQDEGPGRCLRRLRLLSFDFVNQQGDLRIDDLRAYV